MRRIVALAAIAAALLSSTATAGPIGSANLIDPAVLHPGTVAIGPTLSYVSGGNGFTGTANGSTWSAIPMTGAAALAAADHLWLQYDPGILFHTGSAVSALIAIPAIDHGWTAGNTGEFWEPFEFKIFGCATSNLSSCTAAGVITDVWARGVDDTGSSKNADDFTSRWAFNGSFNYFYLVSGDRLLGGPWSPGEGEIDALAIEAPEPSSLAIFGVALLALLGLGVARRRQAW